MKIHTATIGESGNITRHVQYEESTDLVTISSTRAHGASDTEARAGETITITLPLREFFVAVGVVMHLVPADKFDNEIEPVAKLVVVAVEQSSIVNS